MTPDELNSNIDIVLKYFEKDRQINLKTFIPLVVRGLPAEEVLDEMEKRGLISKVVPFDKDEKIYRLTDLGDRVIYMGGWTKYLNHEVEMKRLTISNLKISRWSTVGQFIFNGLVAAGTCFIASVAIVECRDRQKEKELLNKNQLEQVRKMEKQEKLQEIVLDSTTLVQDTLAK